MDELERQLRDLAAHHAAQIPEFDATALTSAANGDSKGPNLGTLLAVAALIVALLVGGGYLLFGRNAPDAVRVVAAPSSSDAPTSTAAPTTAPTTSLTEPISTVPPCPPTGNDTAGQSGAGTVTSVPPLAQLQAVEVRSAQCVDLVTFKFATSVGDWVVGYQAGPLTLNPSGMPGSVAGSAYLVLRFGSTNTSASLSSDFTPEASTGVREVKKIQDFEGVVTWAIGLDSARAFGVSTDAPGQITIDLAR